MAIDDIDILRSELPEAFEDKAPPQDWSKEWHVIQLDDPELSSLDELWVEDNQEPIELYDRWEEWNSPSGLSEAPLPPIGMEWPDGFPGRPRAWNPDNADNKGLTKIACPPPDCFAFYLPFHFYHPDWWGVYLIAEGVLDLASYLKWAAKRQITNSESIVIARRFLYAHESFHHITEAFATRLEVSYRKPLFKSAFSDEYINTYGTDDCREEALANAHALRAIARITKGHPKRTEILDACDQYVEACPKGYRLGTLFKGHSAFLDERCEFAEKNFRLAVPQAPPKDASLWRMSPQAFQGISRINSRVNYLVKRNSPLAARLRLDARYIRAREFIKKLKDAGCEYVGPGKGSHQKWRGPSGLQSVPVHPGDLHSGLVKGIMKRLGITMTLEEFLRK